MKTKTIYVADNCRQFKSQTACERYEDVAPIVTSILLKKDPNSDISAGHIKMVLGAIIDILLLILN